MRTWKVFAVVGGMFGCMSALVIAFNRRDAREAHGGGEQGIDGKTAAMRGGGRIGDAGEAEIDVQEMQFMFSNLHYAPGDPDGGRGAARRRHGDDEEAGAAGSSAAAAQADDFVAAAAAPRAIQRRREPTPARAKRAKDLHLPAPALAARTAARVPRGPAGPRRRSSSSSRGGGGRRRARARGERQDALRHRRDTNRNAHRRENKLEKLDSATKLVGVGPRVIQTDSDSERRTRIRETASRSGLDAKAKSPGARARV